MFAGDMGFNSTIKIKQRQLDCGCFGYAFSRNRCKMHATIEDAKKREVKESKVKSVIIPAGNAELDRWFKERRKELTGFCKHCGAKSCKNSDQYYKFSIAHILPKRLFKSVATHPLNFIELCFWSPSCHTNFDNYTLDIIDLNCFGEVIDKFVAMYPDIAPNERKYIPDALMQYIKIEKDL